jgi:hypothetical protein
MSEFDRDGAFIVTPEWIHKNGSAEMALGERAGWTRKALAVLGVPWPPVKGWLHGLAGIRITLQQKEEFERICRAQTKKVAERNAQQRIAEIF